jgi:hypothetical protein
MSGSLVIRGSFHHDCTDTCVWDVTVTDGGPQSILCGATACLGASEVSGAPFGTDPEDLAHARGIILGYYSWGSA